MAAGTGAGDGRLWAIALGVSLLCNFVVLLALGFYQLATMRLDALRKVIEPAQAQPPAVLLYPEMMRREPATQKPPETKRFAQTSADQQSARPKDAAFIGERDTTATSDRAPDLSAPPLPSQAGEKPREPDDLETTESRYRDGNPDLAAASPALRPSAEPRETTSAQDPPQLLQQQEAAAPPPLKEKLLASPFPVDVQKPLVEEPTKELPKERPTAGKPRTQDTKPPIPAAAAAKPSDPAFSSNRSKKSIVGSISRTGRSALNVENSVLGRYQAAISRAVELEWQRNCVRHRDFITPGFLTVRFLVEPSGKVRSVQFDGEMQTGEIQKGFTLNSIRDAKIPAMPKELRRDYGKEPLELVFRFFF